MLIQALVAASIGLTAWFALALGPPYRSESPSMAWLLAAWAWVTVAFETLLLLALFRVAVPMWMAALVLAAQDAIFGWRLVLLYRARLVQPLVSAPRRTRRTAMDRGSLWWRLVHLDPALWRGLVTAVVALLGAAGILVVPQIPDALVTGWVAAAAIAQALWTRPAVTPNAKVVVAVPDPVGRPDVVVPGQAQTTASTVQIVDAARAVP